MLHAKSAHRRTWRVDSTNLEPVELVCQPRTSLWDILLKSLHTVVEPGKFNDLVTRATLVLDEQSHATFFLQAARLAHGSGCIVAA